MTSPELKQWFSEGSKSWVELSALLKTPVMQKAVKILSDIGTPVNSVPPEGVSFLEWNALLNASREGYAQCLRNFLALANPPPTPPPESGMRPWHHYLREAPEPEPSSAQKPRVRRARKTQKSN